MFNARPANTGSVAGYHPADLQNAYQLPSATAGHGQTVAIVDAYNDPRAASDLATYRSHFGLPRGSPFLLAGHRDRAAPCRAWAAIRTGAFAAAYWR